MGFRPETLERLRQAEEVRIETRRAPSAPAHRTIIWVVVDDDGRVLIRTVRGPASRWYREARAEPDCMLWLGTDPLPVRAVPAPDPANVEAASRGYAAKYRDDPSLASMLADRVLPTTLELKPR